MRLSRAFVPTLREVTADAVTQSHRLMLRAGLIRLHAAGVYVYLPLGWRAMRKAERIVREEMDRAGAQEFMLPVLTRQEIWGRSGRLEEYGDLMFRLTDRKGALFSLAPTHEEIFTELAANEVRSYRDLPQIWYQIQTKFRDEERPRSGVLRARQFRMKDAYSFDRDEAGVQVSYGAMRDAYIRAFERAGITAVLAAADSGLMGGSGSEEFLVVSPSGEAWMAQCQSCGYAANVEAAEARAAPFEAPSGPVEAVHTPQQRTIQEVTAFLELPPQRLMKSLLYMTVEGPLMALIRGDHELSESALASVVGSVPLAATPEVIEEVTGAQAGFIGPQGLDDGVRIVADLTLEGTHGLVTGANQDDYHVVGLEPGRDFRVDGYYPLREVQSGDACVRCGAPIEVLAAIELGHIFNLGTKYSDALGAKFLDANGERRSIVMGSYGIGIERMVAAAIEEHSDDAGIVWPLPLAPYDVHILPINWAHDETRRVAMELDRTLSAQGLSCLLDDRELRAGVKFADADLLGMPLRVTIGERGLGRGEVELRVRKSFEMTTAPVAEGADRVRAMLERLDAGEDS